MRKEARKIPEIFSGAGYWKFVFRNGDGFDPDVLDEDFRLHMKDTGKTLQDKNWLHYKKSRSLTLDPDIDLFNKRVLSHGNFTLKDNSCDGNLINIGGGYKIRGGAIVFCPDSLDTYNSSEAIGLFSLDGKRMRILHIPYEEAYFGFPRLRKKENSEAKPPAPINVLELNLESPVENLCKPLIGEGAEDRLFSDKTIPLSELDPENKEALIKLAKEQIFSDLFPRLLEAYHEVVIVKQWDKEFLENLESVGSGKMVDNIRDNNLRAASKIILAKSMFNMISTVVPEVGNFPDFLMDPLKILHHLPDDDIESLILKSFESNYGDLDYDPDLVKIFLRLMRFQSFNEFSSVQRDELKHTEDMLYVYLNKVEAQEGTRRKAQLEEWEKDNGERHSSLTDTYRNYLFSSRDGAMNLLDFKTKLRHRLGLGKWFDKHLFSKISDKYSLFLKDDHTYFGKPTEDLRLMKFEELLQDPDLFMALWPIPQFQAVLTEGNQVEENALRDALLSLYNHFFIEKHEEKLFEIFDPMAKLISENLGEATSYRFTKENVNETEEIDWIISLINNFKAQNWQQADYYGQKLDFYFDDWRRSLLKTPKISDLINDILAQNPDMSPEDVGNELIKNNFLNSFPRSYGPVYPESIVF